MSSANNLGKQNRLEFVYPKLKISWINKLVQEYNKIYEKKLPFDGKAKEISEADDSVKKLLREIFVSHTLQSRFALKYRFLQFSQYSNAWNSFKVEKENTTLGSTNIDLILRDTRDNALHWVVFVEVMNEKSYRVFRAACTELSGIKSSEIPLKIHFIALKSYRDVPVDESITIRNTGTQTQSWQVPVEIWIEDRNPDRPFGDEDLLKIGDLEVAGFNFSSLEDLLDLIKSQLGEGQFEIQKSANYFSSSEAIKPVERETIWKGIIFPKKVFK